MLSHLTCRYIVIAGVDRLAMFEGTDSGYKVLRAIDLTSCTATSNMLFSDYGDFTISCHSLAGKARTIGAMVCWDFWNGRLASRVALPGKKYLNTLRLRQNGRHFPDDILKCIFLNENI